MKQGIAPFRGKLHDLQFLIILMTALYYGILANNEDEDNEEEGEQLYLKAWAIVQFVTAFIPGVASLLALFFIFSIISAPGPLSSFNAYLCFIILPDALLNAIVSISLFWESTHEGTYASALCKARNSLSFFHYYSNLYLNALVAWQIHVLVKNSYRRLRTNPPPLNKVFRQVAMVYFISAIVVAWFIADVRWSPATITDEVYCVTSTGSPTDDPVFSMWAANAVGLLTVCPPIVYVFWVAYSIWQGHLLPIKGRTRALYFYFFRIVFVFFCFYVPNLSLAMTYMNISEEYRTARFWVLWAFTIMVPIQCLVTLRLALTKKDVCLALQSRTSSLSGFFHPPPSGSDQDWDADDVYSGENLTSRTMMTRSKATDGTCHEATTISESDKLEARQDTGDTDLSGLI